MWKAIKGKGKSRPTLEYLGMPVPEFQEYIAAMFQEGMSWDNHGHSTWHLDHIIPLASFDFAGVDSEEQLSKAFHYSNYQPLWAKDNMQKGAKH